MPAEYIKSLREQYVQNVIKAMVFEVLQRSDLAFTRCYALLSLLDLYEKHLKKRKDGFILEEIFKEAESEGYKATQTGIKAGLDAIYACGIAIKKGRSYNLHPRFEIEVAKLVTDIRKAIGGVTQR